MANKKAHKKIHSKPENSDSKSKKERREELKKMTPQKWVKQNIPMIVVGAIFIVIVMLVLSQNSDGQTVLGATNSTDGPVVEMVYFYLPTCQYCIRQDAFNEQLLEAYPNLRIIKYNMELRSSQEKLVEYQEKIPGLAEERFGTPTTVIGEQYNIGFGTAETTGVRLSQMIEDEMARLEAMESSNTSSIQ